MRPGELERALGIDAGYTNAIGRGSDSKEEKERQQMKILLSTLNVGGIAWVLGQWLYDLKIVDRLPPWSAGHAQGKYAELWTENTKFEKREEAPTKAEEFVIAAQLRRSDPRGSDVRLDVGVPYRPAAWPRASVPARLWTWGAVSSFPWEHDAEHINGLELRSVFNALRWRLRSTCSFRKRFLHLVDSQVVLSILTRGRSSSAVLRGTLRRYNALVLASGTLPVYGYILSGDNPADIPSRWHRKGKSSRFPIKRPGPPKGSR